MPVIIINSSLIISRPYNFEWPLNATWLMFERYQDYEGISGFFLYLLCPQDSCGPVQEKGERQFIIEDNFATEQFTSWFTTITEFECRIWKSIILFFPQLLEFFILYHFYVVLRGNLGVFVSWRFSCTCKQLLQGCACTKHDVVHHTSSSSASSPSSSSSS